MYCHFAQLGFSHTKQSRFCVVIAPKNVDNFFAKNRRLGILGFYNQERLFGNFGRLRGKYGFLSIFFLQGVLAVFASAKF